MVDRIKAAVDAKTDNDFVVMARTDALSVDGLNAVIDRAGAFAEAGADSIFAEAMTEIDMYRPIIEAAGVPVLANLTEFGQTPLYHVDELAEVGIAMALYPLSAFRAMNKAALTVYQALKDEGSQTSVWTPCKHAWNCMTSKLSRLRRKIGRVVCRSRQWLSNVRKS